MAMRASVELDQRGDMRDGVIHEMLILDREIDRALRADVHAPTTALASIVDHRLAFLQSNGVHKADIFGVKRQLEMDIGDN